ncbi:MAG: hypothetical protein ABIJ34_01935 [archaeon]
MGYLDNVPEDKVFILGDKRLSNLAELSDALKAMTVEEYSDYVNSDHNYFADWVYHVISYGELAEDLRKSVSLEEAIDLVENSVLGQRPAKKAKTKTTKPKAPKSKASSKSALVAVPEKKEALVSEPEEKHGREHPEPHFEMLETFDAPVKVNIKPGAKQEEKQDSQEDIEIMLRKISKNENEIRVVLWKHFAWDLAKEFMYGMAVGIIIGFILSRILLR